MLKLNFHQYQRQLYGIKCVGNILGNRYYTLPPRKSYNANRTALELYLSQVPSGPKYFGGVVLSAYSVIHLHPNTIITLGPPIALGSYFLYKKWSRKQRNFHISKVIPANKAEFQEVDDRIRIKSYDETEIYNVLNGMENQYDHFRRQVVDVTERKIIDHVILHTQNEGSDISLFVDENQQVSVNIDENEIETFIRSKVIIPSSFINEEEINHVNDEKIELDFIKFSMPFYSNKDLKTRKRLGIIEIYLLELPLDAEAEKNQYLDYKMFIEITPYSLLASSDTMAIRNSEGHGIYKSKILQESNKTKSGKDKHPQDDEDEITIDINN